MEALNLAVSACPEGTDRLVLDAFAVEQLGECAVAGVSPCIVGEDASDRDPMASLEREGTFHERDDRAVALVWVELAEGEPGMVIDGCVGVVLAELLAPAGS